MQLTKQKQKMELLLFKNVANYVMMKPVVVLLY